MRIKSTVGSASATGSVGRTTQDGTGSSVVTEGSVGESEMMDVESEVGTDVAVVGDGAADWKREVTKAEERGEVGKFSWEEGRK